MARIKVKDIEGQSGDVYKLFEQGGCDLSSYLGAEPQRGKISGAYIFLLTITLFIAACLVWTGILNDAWTKVAILLTFFSGLSTTIIVYYNYKNKTLTVLTGIAALIIALLVLQVYTPKEIIKKIEATTQKHLNK